MDRALSASLAPATERADEDIKRNSDDVDPFRCEPCGGSGTVVINNEEETAKLKAAASPVRPSEAEVEEHRLTHLPYRNWCPECVAGRGLGEQRGRHAGRRHDLPRVGIDYWFITSGGLKTRREMVDEYPRTDEGNNALEAARAQPKLMKCLVIRCHESKAVFAHSVPVKGRDEDNYVANLIASDISFMGHIKLLLKSDNEPALLALGRDALLAIKCQVLADESPVEKISIEHAPEHESQSNGGTECGIRQIRGLFRTIKLCTERRIGQTIPPTHPLAARLVEHVALLLNVFQVGGDCKTA